MAETADDHADPDPPHESPTPEPVDPLSKLDTTLRSGDYFQGLKLVRELRGAGNSDDPALGYRQALCHEGLGELTAAEKAYRSLVNPGGPTGVRLVAAFGLARCRLAAGDVAEAVALLAECESTGGHLPVVRSELAFQAARVAVERLPKPAPGPFAPTAVAWRPIELSADRYFDWLPASVAVESVTSAEVPPPAAPEPDAERAVARALDQPVPHPGGLSLQLAAANLAYRDGRSGDAARGYRRLLDGSPNAPEARPAAYNLGLCLMQPTTVPEARAAFHAAIDRDPGGRTNYLGRWWLGRIELDRGDPPAAKAVWDRIPVGGDKEVDSAVALGTALVHALTDDADRAARTAAVSRTAAAPHSQLVEVFAAAARFDRTPSDTRADALAAAARAADYGRPFGPAGVYQCGRWLTAAGRGTLAADLYDDATAQADGAWAVRMTLAVAEHLYRTGHSARAGVRYHAVAAADAGAAGDAARLRLGELAVRDGDGDTCVRLCRLLLARGPADRAAVLTLMGRGYERLGRPADAADCYAGRTPPLTRDPRRGRP